MKLTLTRIWRLVLALALMLSLVAVLNCSTLGYYGQAALGQTRILLKKRDITKLIESPATPEALREQLRLVLSIREFAVGELHLPDNGSYRSYVELPPAEDGTRRRNVVWNVVAAPELSTAPVTWCFPVAGCVSYRGYFSRARARKFADRLGREGYDVALAGASAYSTLGWFEDPVLSTVIEYPEVYLAGLLFHELAHQVVYVKDDSRFNESFATAVEIEGVRRWLDAKGQDGMESYLARMRREEEFTKMVLSYRDRLQEAYDGAGSTESKRELKAEIFGELKRAYEDLKVSWDGNASYDGWFYRELNNAHLVSVGAYNDFVPGFRALFEEQGDDFESFYGVAQELAELPADEREQRLK